MNKIKPILIVIIILILGLLAVSSLNLFDNSNSENISVSTDIRENPAESSTFSMTDQMKNSRNDIAQDQDDGTIQPENQSEDQPDDWIMSSNDLLSFSHPPEANIEVRPDEIVLTFMGQKQLDSGRTQTELFDGYSFRVGPIENNNALSVAELAGKERRNAIENCHSGEGTVSELKQVTIDGNVGYQYTSVGCYIDYAETIISANDMIIRISQSYAGTPEDQAIYEAITNQIHSSITF